MSGKHRAASPCKSVRTAVTRGRPFGHDLEDLQIADRGGAFSERLARVSVSAAADAKQGYRADA